MTIARRSLIAAVVTTVTTLMFSAPARAQSLRQSDGELELLPLWRWSNTSFYADFNAGNLNNVGASISLAMAKFFFEPVGYVWRILAAVVRYGVTADFLDANTIDQNYAGVAAVVTDARGGLAVFVFLFVLALLIVRALKTGTGMLKQVVRPLFCFALVGALLADVGTATSPGNIAVRVDDISAEAGGFLADAFIRNFQFRPEREEGGGDDLHCNAYLNALYDRYQTTDASSRARIGRTFSAQISVLWEGSFMEAWKTAQFGNNEISDRVFCRLMDYQAGVDPRDQAHITGVAGGQVARPWTGRDPVQLSPFGPYVIDEKEEIKAAMQAWAACSENGLIAPFYVGEMPDNNGDDIDSNACAVFLQASRTVDLPNDSASFVVATTADDDAADTDVFGIEYTAFNVPWADQDSNRGSNAGPWRIKGSDEYNNYASRAATDDASAELKAFYDGLTGRRLGIAAALGPIMLLIVILYARFLGGVAIGLLFGQVVVIGIGSLLPVLLLLMAFPTSFGDRAAKKVGQILIGGLFAKVAAVFVLGILLIVTQTFTRVARAQIEPDTSFIMRLLLLSVGPLIGLWFLKYLAKQLGFSDILTFNGAVSSVSNFGSVVAAGTAANVGINAAQLRRFGRQQRMMSHRARRYGNQGKRLAGRIPGVGSSRGDGPHRPDPGSGPGQGGGSGGGGPSGLAGGGGTRTRSTPPGSASGESLRDLRRREKREQRTAAMAEEFGEDKDEQFGRIVDGATGGAIRTERQAARHELRRAGTQALKGAAAVGVMAAAPPLTLFAAPYLAAKALRSAGALSKAGGGYRRSLFAARDRGLTPDEARARVRSGEQTAEQADAEREAQAQARRDEHREHGERSDRAMPPPTGPRTTSLLPPLPDDPSWGPFDDEPDMDDRPSPADYVDRVRQAQEASDRADADGFLDAIDNASPEEITQLLKQPPRTPKPASKPPPKRRRTTRPPSASDEFGTGDYQPGNSNQRPRRRTKRVTRPPRRDET